ncbi:MAG TPA: TIGR03118 family protein [Pyrinomonadaceae bacterium]|nr:TIGR03118 family protein [Pyrinomonadaceae bacterium]
MTDRRRLVVVFGILLLIISIALIFGAPQSLVTASAGTTAKESNNAQRHSQFYLQHNLLSDVAGLADQVDPNLVNAWGLDSGPTTPWWVSDNGTGKATLYNVSSATIVAIFTVPGAGGAQGRPTGLVFNGGTGFVVNNGIGAPSAARFIFSGEDGTIAAFKGAPIVTVVPNANAPAHGAIYKGLAIDSRTAGQFLYATDFHNGKVDVFDSSFHAVTLAGNFTDPNLPPGFAPFGIQNIGGTIYVTYALQDEDQEDDVAGPGNGFVDAFDTSGNFIHRVASMGELNSPWGLALAPADFGRFSGDLLVGNFGDGRIHAFDPTNLTPDGEFEAVGLLHSAGGPPIQIDGLWSLQFGHGANASSANGITTTLFFTAGPADEEHGLFGSIVSVSPPGRQ